MKLLWMHRHPRTWLIKDRYVVVGLRGRRVADDGYKSGAVDIEPIEADTMPHSAIVQRFRA